MNNCHLSWHCAMCDTNSIVVFKQISNTGKGVNHGVIRSISYVGDIRNRPFGWCDHLGWHRGYMRSLGQVVRSLGQTVRSLGRCDQLVKRCDRLGSYNYNIFKKFSESSFVFVAFYNFIFKKFSLFSFRFIIIIFSKSSAKVCFRFVF